MTKIETQSKLRVLKGAEIWASANAAGSGRYVQIRRGDTLTVLSVVDRAGEGCAVRLGLRDGSLACTLHTSSAKKLDRAEFNLNTGDPTRFLRLERK